MHAYNGVLTILGLAHVLCFCKGYTFCFFIVKIKFNISLLCVCVHFAWKGRPRNDLCCVGWDVKPYSLTHSLVLNIWYHTALETPQCDVLQTTMMAWLYECLIYENFGNRIETVADLVPTVAFISAKLSAVFS